MKNNNKIPKLIAWGYLFFKEYMVIHAFIHFYQYV